MRGTDKFILNGKAVFQEVVVYRGLYLSIFIAARSLSIEVQYAQNHVNLFLTKNFSYKHFRKNFTYLFTWQLITIKNFIRSFALNSLVTFMRKMLFYIHVSGNGRWGQN